MRLVRWVLHLFEELALDLGALAAVGATGCVAYSMQIDGGASYIGVD